MNIPPRIRDDLIYTEDHSDNSFFFVKDPIRGQFFRFNELQVAMMRRLDGETPRDLLLEELSEDYGMELEDENLNKFVAHLKKSLLLDISAYDASDPKIRQKLRARLIKDRVLWRGAAEHFTQAPINDVNLLFHHGLYELEHGDPCQATRYFVEVLQVAPDHRRARELYRAIHYAFFEIQKGTPAGFITFPLVDPDRILTRIDRAVGRWIFSYWGLLAMAALCLWAIIPLVEFKVSSISTFHWWDFLFTYFIAVLLILLHEVGHGLACKHYGGTVNEMGLLLIYGLIPGAYCDVSDSYTFAERKDKVMVSMAGTFVSVTEIAVMLLIYHYSSEGFFLKSALLLTLAISFWPTLKNLNPFVQFDGYYALADALDIPNLRERSFRYLGLLFKEKVLGIKTDAPSPTPRERRIFILFGLGAALYSTALILGLWVMTLLPLAIEHLHFWGIVLTALFAYYILGKLVFRPGVQFFYFLREHRQELMSSPRVPALGLAAIASLGLLFMGWPLYIDGDFTVEPQRRAQVIAQQSGLIAKVHVREGQQVEAGALLVELRNDELQKSLAMTQTQLRIARTQVQLLTAGTRIEELEISRAQAQEASIERRYARRESALRRRQKQAQLVTAADADASRLQRLRSRAHAQKASSSLALLKAGTREEDLLAATATLKELEIKLNELKKRVVNLEIRSPINGTIVGSQLLEKEHQLLESGQRYCEVHDLERIKIELHLPPGSLYTEVQKGQSAALRLKGDPHRLLDATVATISPVRSTDGTVKIRMDAVPNPGWPSGASGHGRIYGERRAIAYQLMGIRLLQLLYYEGWRLWGD